MIRITHYNHAYSTLLGRDHSLVAVARGAVCLARESPAYVKTTARHAPIDANVKHARSKLF